MGFVPEKIRPLNTMGHKTRTKWSTHKDHGTTSVTAMRGTTYTSATTATPPRSFEPEYDFPIKRIRRTAGILLILFLLWALIYGLKVF